MEIINKNIQDLNDAEYNPRQLTKEQYKQLEESINKFGIVDPIVINSNIERPNVIIGGHQRVKVAKKMGIKDVPCVELDLSLNEEKELNIRLNKNVGQWDFDILANMFDVDNLLQWGFEDYELGVNSDDGVNTNDLWEGMPEYDNDEIAPYKSIKLNFKSEEDMQMFCNNVQKITKDTKTIWYPKLVKEVFIDKEYRDEK